MLACTDVHYGPEYATAAVVLFERFEDTVPTGEVTARRSGVAEYHPGRFYERELPVLLDALGKVTTPLEAILVDGHVWLGPGIPGLGAHLHEALGGKTAVIGVAKSAFRGSPNAERVLRGRSRRPLFVTAVGIDPHESAEAIRRMAGPNRIPTLLARADALSRGNAS